MTNAWVWTKCVGTAAFALALGAVTSAAAQSSATADSAAAAEPRAAPAEPRRRDRRRSDDAAAAQAPALPTAAAADSAAADEPKQICKNVKPIGSRVARRICGTEEQWAADNARTSSDAAESMRQIRDRSGVTGGASSGPASLGTPSFGR